MEKYKDTARLVIAVVFPIFKRVSKSNCGHYRGIRFFNVGYMIFSTDVAGRRMWPLIEAILLEGQSGFSDVVRIGFIEEKEEITKGVIL